MATDGPDIDGYRVRVTATMPGDVVAFDLHTWHASFGGRDRLEWTITHQRCPETTEQRERTLRSTRDSFEQSCRGFDRGRYPMWRDWLAGSATHPRRCEVASRLRATGVLDLDGAEFGWWPPPTPVQPLWPRRGSRLIACSPMALYTGAMRRIVVAALAGYVLVAVATRGAEALGLGGRRLRCGCVESCWCQRPGMTMLRWVTPGRWHRIGLSPQDKARRAGQSA
jgi:hypothetical protein